MNKDIKTRKEITLSLFAENKIVYIENPKKSELSGLINEFSSVFVYKAKIQIYYYFHKWQHPFDSEIYIDGS